MPVFVLDHCGAGVTASASDHVLPQLVDVVRGNGLRERQFACKHRGNTNFVGFNVDVRGDDRTSSVVDTFALKEHKPPA